MPEMNTINLHPFSYSNLNTSEEYIESFLKNTRKLQGSCSIKQIVKPIVWLIMRNTFGYFSNIFQIEKSNEEVPFLLSLVFPS